MKIVINRAWGGFTLPDEFCTNHDCNRYSYYDDYGKEIRQNAELIEIVSDENYNGVLKVCEIPDEVTDWEINDYDGMESVVYVLNGKLYHTH